MGFKVAFSNNLAVQIESQFVTTEANEEIHFYVSFGKVECHSGAKKTVSWNCVAEVGVGIC